MSNSLPEASNLMPRASECRRMIREHPPNRAGEHEKRLFGTVVSDSFAAVVFQHGQRTTARRFIAIYSQRGYPLAAASAHDCEGIDDCNYRGGHECENACNAQPRAL